MAKDCCVATLLEQMIFFSLTKQLKEQSHGRNYAVHLAIIPIFLLLVRPEVLDHVVLLLVPVGGNCKFFRGRGKEVESESKRGFRKHSKKALRQLQGVSGTHPTSADRLRMPA